MKNKYIFIPILAGLILGGFLLFPKNNSSPNKASNKPSIGIKQISADEFDELSQNSDVFIVDVHTPEQTHLPKTDAFIAYNEIEQNADKLPEDKNTPIVVYCRSGSMSKSASGDLAKLGYENVYDLTGGVEAYKTSRSFVSVDPEEKDLGTVVYGDIAKTEFRLVNYTSSPLKITRISTSCGCTSADISAKEIAPYEDALVFVSFDPAFHKDDTDVGDITRTVYIETDSKDFDKLTAEITANVVKK